MFKSTADLRSRHQCSQVRLVSRSLTCTLGWRRVQRVVILGVALLLSAGCSTIPNQLLGPLGSKLPTIFVPPSASGGSSGQTPPYIPSAGRRETSSRPVPSNGAYQCSVPGVYTCAVR